MCLLKVSSSCLLLLLRHRSCYTELNQVIILLAIQKSKNLRKKKKIHYHLINGCFTTFNQFMMTTVEFLLQQKDIIHIMSKNIKSIIKIPSSVFIKTDILIFLTFPGYIHEKNLIQNALFVA